jgi:hypothetical protein
MNRPTYSPLLNVRSSISDGHWRLVGLENHLHQESLLFAWHVESGFFRLDRGLQASFHMPSEILRLV